MQLSDYHFDLPEALIAQQPLPQRSASRLLVLDGAQLEHRQIADLPCLLRRGDYLVFNDTRVIPARLYGHKQTGGRVEILIERMLDHQRLLVKLRSSKSPRPGSRLRIGTRDAQPDGQPDSARDVEVIARHDDLFELRVELADGESLDAFIEAHGDIPLPPYIQRSPDADDAERYQTIYARDPGAVAAPTAGLHFDPVLFAALAQAGIGHGFITLHVGAGTFQPVRVDNPADHVMHPERVAVSAAIVSAIKHTRASGGRVIAVGTTSVRALEAAAASGKLQPFTGDTQLFLTPGSRFHTVDGIITNFHLPESTLLMLICAFAGTRHTLAAYREAVACTYRFFSYGDAMLGWPADTQSPADRATPS
jgi:S-adenosylmethionine:tRNA ribosyltransferase-isomerase